MKITNNTMPDLLFSVSKTIQNLGTTFTSHAFFLGFRARFPKEYQKLLTLYSNTQTAHQQFARWMCDHDIQLHITAKRDKNGKPEKKFDLNYKNYKSKSQIWEKTN